MPHGGWYGYVGSLTRPVTYRSETEGAAMPLRGLYGYSCFLTRPVTYRSKTVGMAERVLCPVRCVANAFSCVLSGCWQLPWHQAFDRTPMNALPPTDGFWPS